MNAEFGHLCLDEDGAVTVDWVVLAGAVIGMGLIVIGPVATGTENLSERIGIRIGLIDVGFMSN